MKRGTDKQVLFLQRLLFVLCQDFMQLFFALSATNMHRHLIRLSLIFALGFRADCNNQKTVLRDKTHIVHHIIHLVPVIFLSVYTGMKHIHKIPHHLETIPISGAKGSAISSAIIDATIRPFHTKTSFYIFSYALTYGTLII